MEDILKRWRGYFGELHREPKTIDDIPVFVNDCKFTWRMRYSQGEVEEFEYIEGLGVLEELERLVVYRNICQTAENLAASGTGKRRDIRRIAQEYPFLAEKICDLEEDHERLEGGPSIEYRVSPSDRFFQIRRNTDYRNHGNASFFPEYEEANKKLGFGLVQVKDIYGKHVVSGPKQYVQTFLELTNIISNLIQEAYNRGFEDGTERMSWDCWPPEKSCSRD